MRKSSEHTCNACLQRFFSSTPWTASTQKRLPPRIFTTATNPDQILGHSADSKEGTGNLRTSTSSGLSNSHNQLTSAERLSQEFHRRVRGQRVRDSKRLDDRLSERSNVIKLRSGQPDCPEAVLGRRVSPDDLLQRSDISESEETITLAIESCVRTALHRLAVPGVQGAVVHPGDSQLLAHDQYLWLCTILKYQFTKHQLVLYGAKCGLVKSQLARLRTDDAIRLILDKVWNLKKEDEIPSDGTMVTKGCSSSLRS